MAEKIVTLDVRPDIRQGREPFSKIMLAASRLKENETLLLIAPFKPVPLFGVLEQQGFSHEAKPTPDGDWEVLFRRGSAKDMAPPAASASASSCTGDCGYVREVDARGLEPPQPLAAILEALARLPAGAGLRAHTDRRPMHLYAKLRERGFVGESEEQNDGSFITYIRRS